MSGPAAAISGVSGVRAERSWRDRVHALRDRFVASPRFRRLASSFPLTRPIARRRSRELFDLCAGFVYSQVLLACVQLRVFDILADGPLSLDDLARRTTLPLDATRRLVGAATALRLLERRSGRRIGLGPLGAAMVGNAGVTAMIEHHPMLYGDLANPVALLRGEGSPTNLSRYWPYAGLGSPHLRAEQVGPYSGLMAASLPMVADEILDAYPLRGHRRLLDVGCGDGSFLAAVAPKAPGLELVGFDLPAVAELARARFGREGLASRASAIGGDATADPLPGGCDVVSLVRIIHDHDDAKAMSILKAAARALMPGGTLLLAEPMAGTAGAEPIGDAYFNFYLLAMGCGRARTTVELTDMLRRSGFDDVRLRRTGNPLVTSVLTAKRVTDVKDA